MARRIREEDLRALENAVRGRPEGATAREIAEALRFPPPRRTLLYRLKTLVDGGRLVVAGAGRRTRYRTPVTAPPAGGAGAEKFATASGIEAPPWLSEPGAAIREYVRRPIGARAPVGYDRSLLDSYRPNETFHLARDVRTRLRDIGGPASAERPAGTYARRILNRLLIDLSWNSSRLEGNAYSLLDTERLIDLGEEAEGKTRREARMILNHKEAIGFLTGAPEEIGFNRYTVLNLHALLAADLLADPAAAGRLRHIGVGIDGSVFHPLESPQLVEEYFDRFLDAASQIADPFEQSFFAMVHIPYLQPFDDVNKRVSRLSANIPLIRANLSPLSFEDTPRGLYTEALMGVYEMNRVDLLRDVFVWAYERSAARYGAIRQSLGDPDPFRWRNRTALREVVGAAVRGRMDRKRAAAHIDAWAREHVDREERGRFRDVAERELLSLHEGNFARYRIAPSEFAEWRRAWDGQTDAARQRSGL